MSISPEVLVEKLVALRVVERGARALVAWDPDLALDVIEGKVNSPKSGPPVGPDGEVWVTSPGPRPVEHHSSCHDCGGQGHPDGDCRYCAEHPYW